MARWIDMTGWEGGPVAAGVPGVRREARVFAKLGPALLLVVALLLGLMRTGAAHAQEDAYILGPSDVISVMVYGQDEFNIQTRIKPDGSIVMPLIGKVTASGQTVIGLADDIAGKLRRGNFLRDPIVNIEVSQYNSQYVRVVGMVGSPTIIPLDRPYNVLDVLLRAGWVRADGSRYVLLHRAAGGEPERIDTDELARSGPAAQITLRPGDTLFVEPAEVVYLTGQVLRPGAYQLEPDMTIAKLLAMAGGVGPTGNSSKFDVRRDEGEKQRVDDQFVLQKGDVVNVRERLF